MAVPCRIPVSQIRPGMRHDLLMNGDPTGRWLDPLAAEFRCGTVDVRQYTEMRVSHGLDQNHPRTGRSR